MARLVLSSLAWLFHYQPKTVILVGRHDFRLAQVPEAFCIHERHTADVAAAIREAAGENGVDAAIMAVGTAQAVDLCIQSLRPRGRLAIFSAIPNPAPVDLFRVHLKELELLGSCNDEDALDDAITCLANPLLQMDKIVTHRIPFLHWGEAFDLAAHGKDQAIKVALTFEELKL